MSVANTVDPLYYAGLSHQRTIQSSTAMLVSGHQAWVVTFLMTYPDAASEGLAWTSEAGAVVVVDRGRRPGSRGVLRLGPQQPGHLGRQHPGQLAPAQPWLMVMSPPPLSTVILWVDVELASDCG